MQVESEMLRGLIARVEAATGPDRELDRDFVGLFGRVNDSGFPVCAGIVGVDAFTGSIDAARRLTSEMLPGWSQESGRSGFGNPAWCRLWNPAKIPGAGNTVRTDHTGGSEPLAILAALLRALLTQSEEFGHGE